METFATALGIQKDASYYHEMFLQLAKEYNQVFYNPSQKRYDIGVQSSWVLPLWLGVVPNDDYSTVVSLLLADIEDNDNHLTTGILGTKYLMLILSDVGRDDVALEILLQTTYPGWLFMITQTYEVSATTLWELWDSPVGNPGMDSRAHHMFGSVGYWFYRNLAGIQQPEGSTGFAKITFVPPCARVLLYGALSSFQASVNTIQGPVASSWVSQGGQVCSPIVTGGSAWPSELNCGPDGGSIQSIWIAHDCSDPASTYNRHNVSEECQEELSSCYGKSSCDLYGVSQSCSQPNIPFTSSMKVVAKCSNQATFRWTVTVPVSSTATVTLRKMGLSNPQITSVSHNGSSVSIWENGQFTPSDHGIVGALDDNLGNIIVSIVSGTYTFVVSGATTPVISTSTIGASRLMKFTCPAGSAISVISSARVECDLLDSSQRSSNLLVHLIEQQCLGADSCTFVAIFNNYTPRPSALQSCLKSSVISANYICSY